MPKKEEKDDESLCEILVANLEQRFNEFKVKDYPKMESIFSAYEQALQAGVEENIVKQADNQDGIDSFTVVGDTELARRLKWLGDTLFLVTTSYEFIVAASKSLSGPQPTEVIVPIAIGSGKSRKNQAKKPESITGMKFADGKSIQDILDEAEGDDK